MKDKSKISQYFSHSDSMIGHYLYSFNTPSCHPSFLCAAVSVCKAPVTRRGGKGPSKLDPAKVELGEPVSLVSSMGEVGAQH